MSKIVSIITTVFMLLTVFAIPTPAFATQDTEIKWTEGISGGAIYFDTASGAISSCDDSVTEVVIPNKINSIEVTSIGDAAFWDCTSLTNISISDSVTSIGDSAFAYCTSLTNITIPDSVTSIGDSTFYGCESLKSITIPDSVTSIGEAAFYICTSLQEVSKMSSGITEIKPHTFAGCHSLKEVELHDGIKSIGEYAFSDCRLLMNINLPKEITRIERHTFEQCFSLREIKIPSRVKTIGYGAFENCHELEKIAIPDSVTRIESYAFSWCESLSQIYLPNGITKLEEGVFSFCKSLKKIDVPKSVITIGRYAFDGCTFETMTVPNSVKYIEEGAFWGCESLKTINIPSSVISIENDVFHSCYDVKIYGEKGSHVESYANNNDIPFVAIGDGVKDALNKNIDVLYNPSYSDKNSTISVRYMDAFFAGDNSQYNLGLAKVSLAASMASMTALKTAGGKEIKLEDRNVNIENMLDSQLDFDDYKAYNYDVSLKDTSDKVAFSLAHKTVKIDGKSENILVVVIRSGDYGGEWGSNGRVEGGYDSNLHNGFSSAALKVTEQTKTYMNKYSLDPKTTKVWISGFSRGAAVSNLLAKKMLEANMVNSQNLYCYTFATPKTTQAPQTIRGIFNTINPIDIVPEVPLADWGYNYYGKTLYLPSKSNSSYSNDLKKAKANFKEITGKTYDPYTNHRTFVSLLIDTVNNAVGNSEAKYYKMYQNNVSNALAKCMGKADSKIDIPALLLSVGINASSPKDAFYINATARCGSIPISDIIANGLSSQAMKQHWPEAYMAWLNVGNLFATKSSKLVKVKCPVDIIVYDENDQVVAKIIDNNALDFIENNPDIALDAYVDENGEKQILIPDDGDYRVEVIATDNGKMNYSLEEYDEEGNISKKINYNDISIKTDDVFEAEVPASNENGNTEDINIIKNDDTEIKATEVLQEDTLNTIDINVSTTGDGYVIGGGSYSSCDSVVLSAVSLNGSNFAGWYENGICISTENTYGFIAEKDRDRNITAKFLTGIKDENVKIKSSNYAYTGKQIKPEPTVTVNGKKLVKDTDYSVSYGTNKYPGYGSVKVTGKGNYAGSVTKKFIIALAKVTGLKASSTGTNSIKLSWNKQPNVKGYKVYRLTGGKYKLIKTISGSKYTSYTVKNLPAGSGQKFKVRTYVGSKPYYGEYSSVLSVPTKPGKVTLSKLKTGRTHYVKATWKKKTGTGYQVKIATNSKFTKNAKTYKVTSYKTTSKTIKKLKKGKTYYVKVRAYKTYGGKTQYGSWSKYKKIKCK